MFCLKISSNWKFDYICNINYQHINMKGKSFIGILLLGSCLSFQSVSAQKSGNPIFEGWYADPEGIIYDDTYWIYPT